MSQKPSKPTFVFDHSKCLCPYGLRESRKKGGSSKLQSTHNRDKKATNGNIAKSRPEPEAEPQTQDTRVGMGSVRMITKPGDFNSKQLPSQSSLQGGQLELSVMRNWNVKAQAMALERFGKRDSAQMEAGGSNIQSTVQNASIGKGKGKERARSISSDHDSPGHKRAKVANGNMQDVGETNQEVASTSGSRPELVMIGLGPEHTTDTYEEQRSARKRRKPTRPDAHLPSPPPKRPRKSGESRTSAARNVNGTERATKPDPRIQKKAAQGRSFQRFQSRIETGMQSKILNQATYPRKKPFKEGELVFLSFQRPISGPSGDGSDDIRHWPAKIKKYTLSEDAYTIQPLGLADTQIVPSVHHASLLPYVAGQVPEQVITSLLSKDLTKSEYSVVRDYITGLWMAQRSAQTWGFGNSEARPPCLEEISSTEANISMSSSIPIYYRPTPPSSFSASKSFPYLWWGPERLEVNDLLRLKPSRNAFQDASIPNVYQVLPPSGPGRMMMQSCGNVVGLPLDGIMGGVISGAGLRGVVLRVREFFVEKNANDSDNDKPTWIVYACGMLYELADADWEQPYSMNEHAELPAAPKNYKFRPILSSTSEVVVSMDLVAGKYYAEASSHPSLANLVGDTLSSTASAGTRGVDYLWALECIVPGEMNVVFPATTTDKHRKEEEEGGQALPVWFWHEKAREELTETSDIMDQDTVKEKLENLKVT
ncbi:hypothetical protein VKT23_013346 [Stygiomarasmius scandens]|uniref:Uncharacterized protein n=1 Tax=Marasmiellus scandens TaxID=2682957 RepID=A0ABR1J3R6_9AGAR